MAVDPAGLSAGTVVPTRAATRWGAWTRDPFLHFLAIGLALLVLYELVAPPRPTAPGLRIELKPGDIRQIQLAFASKWKRPPSDAETRALVESNVREEVLYREALAMGLDQDDVIVKRRLAQKLEFLTEDLASLREPTTVQLQDWFAGHAGQFATPASVTFRHLYFSPDTRGAKAEADARAALAMLTQGRKGEGAEGLGDRFPDHDYYADASPDQLSSFFGVDFAKSVLALQPGGWRGPVRSGLGWHLVWVQSVTLSHVPSFAEADAMAVKNAWIDEQRADSKRKMFEAMRAKYEVVLPGDDLR